MLLDGEKSLKNASIFNPKERALQRLIEVVELLS